MAGTPGYLPPLKTTVVEAVQKALVLVYPETDPQGGQQPVYCSLDYPVREQNVPAVWVDFEPTQLTIAGIDYTEIDAGGNLVTRWRFQGFATFTMVAMASNECDLVYDQLVSLIAFSAQSEDEGTFRSFVDNQPLIGTNWSFDTIEGRAQGPSIGTPWGTDDIMYERGIAIQVQGEFVSSPSALTLVALAEIQILATDVSPGGGTTESDITRNSGPALLEPPGRNAL